jgi:hypothetical protein
VRIAVSYQQSARQLVLGDWFLVFGDWFLVIGEGDSAMGHFTNNQEPTTNNLILRMVARPPERVLTAG